MKKRIILIGALYYRNLGDAALCYITREMLTDDFEVTLLDIYGRTDFPAIPAIDISACRKNYNNTVCRMKLRDVFLRLGIVPYDRRKKKMFEAVENQLAKEIEQNRPAAIVLAGGALFKGVFINSLVNIVDQASRSNIPVMFNACGIDAAMRPTEWKKLEQIFSSPTVRYISVRDGYDMLVRRFPKISFHDTFDSAICANKYYLKSDDRKGIGLGVMLSYNIAFNVQVAFWSKLVKRFSAERRRWRMFTNGSPADQNFAALLLQINHKSLKRLIAAPETPENLFRTISGFEAIVSMRLHSHILAYSAGVPSVAISWDQKINEFFDKVGKPENCLDFYASEDKVIDRLISSLTSKDYFDDQSNIESQVESNISSLKVSVG